MKTILMLEDNEERLAGFAGAVATLGEGFELKAWPDAPSMMAECARHFPTAALISLDHDLNPRPGGVGDPGTGLKIAEFLGDFLPVCPVLIHSSNTERAYSMHNELRFADWKVDRVGPLGADWIETSWLRAARRLMEGSANTWHAQLPADHTERVARMSLSLDGVGLGDSLGEMFFSRPQAAPRRLAENQLPAGPWCHTDDTEMAISICSVLKAHGSVHQDALAKRFVRRFEREPERGYGRMTRLQMAAILRGAEWRRTAASAFEGQGSMGNGSAMRIPPLGAYFADDLERCAEEARASSVVTHTHPEGVAGAIATAVGAAMAWQLRDDARRDRGRDLFAAVLQRTPDGEVRRRVGLASKMAPDTPVSKAALVLGNGSRVTAPDTVPFCLWMAARQLDGFVEALGQTISAEGDCDTNAAIVGGIVALSGGREKIPGDWLAAREVVFL